MRRLPEHLFQVLFLALILFSIAYAAGVVIQNRDLTISGGNLILPDKLSCEILNTDSTGVVGCTTLSAIGGVYGSGTAGYLAKWTGASNIGTSIIYDNGTNIGIGTSTPTAKLDVNGDIHGYGNLTLGTGATNFIRVGVNLRIYSKNSFWMHVRNATDTDYVGVAAKELWINTATVIDPYRNLENINNATIQGDLNVANTTLYVSSSTSQIGVGTASPAYKLDVAGGTRANYLIAGSQYAPRTTNARIIIPGPTSDFIMTVQDGTGRVQMYWNSTIGTAPTYLVSNEAAGKLLFNPAGNPWFVLFWAPSGTQGSAIAWQTKFSVYTDGSVAASSFKDLQNGSYYVDPANTTTSAILAGNVGIGTTTPAYKLDVTGDIRATGQIIAGDLVFKNGFRFVEDGNDALALLNPSGEVVMRIDSNGNIWIKGKIHEG